MKAGQLMKFPRHLLRDISRNVFYKGPGDWTADVEQAMSFSDVQELIATSKRCEITDAEVVEHFPGGQLDFHLPVSHCDELSWGKRGQDESPYGFRSKHGPMRNVLNALLQ